MLKRISITGPESTGKTKLTEMLTRHYSANMVYEFARDFFDGKEYEYTLEDLDLIARSQLDSENKIASVSHNYLFCDTDQLVMKIWSAVVFDTVSDWIEKHAREHVYDLYLLCYPDIEWKSDRFRKNPDNRQYLFDLYVNELERYNFNYRIVKGVGEQRIRNAISFVDELR